MYARHCCQLEVVRSLGSTDPRVNGAISGLPYQSLLIAQVYHPATHTAGVMKAVSATAVSTQSVPVDSAKVLFAAVEPDRRCMALVESTKS